MALIKIFFKKNYKKLSSGWGLCPHTPKATIWDTFKLQLLTQCASQVRHLHLLTISLSLFPEAKFCLSAKKPRFRSSILRYLCPKKIPLLKFLDNVIACDLWLAPSNQKSWLRLIRPSCLRLCKLVK